MGLSLVPNPPDRTNPFVPAPAGANYFKIAAGGLDVKVAIVLGTRPEIIKMAPIIRLLEERREEYLFLHTGQHYDFNMDGVFFDEFKLREPDVNLNVGSGSHGETTGKIIMGVERVLIDMRPDVVLVNGDTNTTLAGALAAVKLHVICGHVEAGIRNYDRRMPEEYNRIVADHVSDYLFATSKLTARNLVEEGISGGDRYLYFGKFDRPKIRLTGNTIVDVVQEIVKLSRKSDILGRMGLEAKNYLYVTAHREENVDYPDRLTSIISGLNLVSDQVGMPMILPLHPRTRSKLERFGLIKGLLKVKKLRLIEPIGYVNHLALVSKAALVMTDSGGIQEETCTLRVPAVVLREVTDRPEGLKVGATALTGLDPQRILKMARVMIDRTGDWPNPYGDGKAARRIVDTIYEGV